MSVRETPVIFNCAGESLLGIMSVPQPAGPRGVLIVVGGPQYRVGSHRQFILLARHLADSGVPVLRFDYRGMGDSSGALRNFEDVESDIGCAIDRFFASVTGMREIVLWGLCDAASASLFYAHRDPRVTGVVLANPWVRTEQGAARAYLRHYYLARVLQPDFWRKVMRGEWRIGSAVVSLRELVHKAGSANGPAERSGPPDRSTVSLPDRMADGLRRFKGRVLLILSGKDFVANEFCSVASTPAWRRLLRDPRVTRHELPEANHTFARREWRDHVAQLTCSWLKSW